MYDPSYEQNIKQKRKRQAEWVAELDVIILHDFGYFLGVTTERLLPHFKGWLRLFPDFGLFCKINQKCSRVTSNFHIIIRVGAFESSDNEETFSYVFHDFKTTYKKVSRRTQTCQLLCFS
eukprot:UN09230